MSYRLGTMRFAVKRKLGDPVNPEPFQ